jgi:hypothetical protein
MLHFTCDGCGKKLRAGEDHHVVKIEVFASHGPAALTEADLEEDHMEAVSQLLRDMEDLDESETPEPSAHHHRYDLCPGCCKRYLRDPLGRDAAQKFDFSEN